MNLKRILITSFLAVWLLAGCLQPQPAPSSGSSGNSPDAPSANTVRAESSRDGVFTIRGGSRQTLSAPQTANLSVGDGVDVDTPGRAILRFSDLLNVEVLRQGGLKLQQLAVDQQSAAVTVLQTGGVLLNDFNAQAAINHRLTIQTDFATITATGTRFLVVHEGNSPLEWVIGLDARENDLHVTAGGITEPVPSGMARWMAASGGPSEGIHADMQNVDTWIANLREGKLVKEIGEVVWQYADVVANTQPLGELASPGRPFNLQGGDPTAVQIILDAQGYNATPEYYLQDCNGDGINDIAMQNGRLLFDFRPVQARVQSLDLTVLNQSDAGTGGLVAFDPSHRAIDKVGITVGPNQGEVLSLRAQQPYHYAELTMRAGCFLGFSLTPPAPGDQPGSPRPAVGQYQTGPGLIERPIAVRPLNPVIVERLARSVRITDIVFKDPYFVVTFQAGGFQPERNGTHLHFFFDTVDPKEAGVPGKGPWTEFTDGTNPFTGYTYKDRPLNAKQLCVLVANADETVLQDSGNCFELPLNQILQ